ncbi:MAG: RNB domain-containing ribonuclease [Candidatus Cloacimonetes bacterium]|nr:RNB domain-containing ribonuclease [Candidatus Cloacimonadota bacterium]
MTSIQIGLPTLFFQSGELLCGLITGIQKNQVQVAGILGDTHLFPPGRLCLIGNTPLDISNPSQSLQALQKRIIAQEDLMPQLLTILADGLPRTFPQISQHFPAADDALIFALFKTLRDNGAMIALKKGSYRLMNPREQAEVLQRRKAEEERRQYLHKVSTLISNPEMVGSAEPEDIVQLAQELRLLQREQIPADLASLIQKQLPLQPLPANLIKLRMRINDLPADTEPPLAASGLPLHLSHTLEAGRQYQAETPANQDWEVICVDDHQTKDYDDAISIRRLQDGFIIGVHIAHLSRYIHPASELFFAALERVSSIYLPSTTINMLPNALAESEYCLKSGTLRPVLSLYCHINREYEIQSWEFISETIAINANTDYKELESRLAKAPFCHLQAFCNKLRSARSEGNPIYKAPHGYHLQVQDGSVCIKKIDFQSPARLLLEELMILYNIRMAALASASQYPFIYRNINSFEDKMEEDEEGGFRHAVQAFFSTQAAYHPGIGVKAYLHGTSPIRRIVDLINQTQFSALLEGVPAAFSRADLDAMIPAMEKRILLQRETLRRSERHWLLVYLMQKWLNRPLDATFIRRLKKGGFFELLPWQKRIVAVCDDYPAPDDEIKLLIYEVDLAKALCRADVIV